MHNLLKVEFIKENDLLNINKAEANRTNVDIEIFFYTFKSYVFQNLFRNCRSQFF